MCYRIRWEVWSWQNAAILIMLPEHYLGVLDLFQCSEHALHFQQLAHSERSKCVLAGQHAVAFRKERQRSDLNGCVLYRLQNTSDAFSICFKRVFYFMFKSRTDGFRVHNLPTFQQILMRLFTRQTRKDFRIS